MANTPTPVKMVPSLPPEGAPAAQNTPPARLDNPPRIRSAGVAPIQTIAADPFQGLAYTDILHLRAALIQYQESLVNESDVLNLETIQRIKQMQELLRIKLNPTQQAISPI